MATLNAAFDKLRDVVTVESPKMDDAWRRILPFLKQDRDGEYIGVVSGYGLQQYTGEYEPLKEDTRSKGNRAKVYVLKYVLKTSISDEADMTDVNGLVTRDNAMLMAKAVAASAATTAWSWLNDAFDATVTGVDGVTFANTAHPWGTAGGVTYSNTPGAGAPLSYATLSQARAGIRRQKSPRNLPMLTEGGWVLCVPPELETTAESMMVSTQVPWAKGASGWDSGTPDVNDSNVLAKAFDRMPLVTPYIEASDYWALVPRNPDDHRLRMHVRMQNKHERWRDQDRQAYNMSVTDERAVHWAHAANTWVAKST